MKSRSYALLAVFCGALALVLLAARAAFADPSIPDPVTDPLGSLSLADKLYHSGAYLCLGIVAAFVALRYASQHVAWLEQPGRAHYVTAFLGGLALVAVPASQGATPNLNMIVIAIGTVVTLCAPGVPQAQKSPQAGFVRLALLLPLAGICAGVLACDSCGAPTPVPVADLIDCVKLEAGANWLAVEAQLKPDVDAHDWSKLVTDAEAIAPKLGLEVAGCVAAELVQQYLSTKQADKSATWGAHDAIEHLRAKLSPPGKSATFHTSHGNL